LQPDHVDRRALRHLVQRSLYDTYAPQLLHTLWKE
jgi:hypothetical protein